MYAFVQKKQNSISGGSSSTVASGASDSPITAGNALFWAVAYSAASARTITIAGNSNTYVEVGNFRDATTQIGLIWGYAENVNSGSTELTATFSAAVSSRSIMFAEYSGLRTDGTIYGTDEDAQGNQATPGTGTDAVTTGSITPGEQPAVLIGFAFNVQAGNTPSAGSSFSDRGGVWVFGGANNFARLEDRRLTATTAVAATFTATSNQRHLTAAVVLRETVSASEPIELTDDIPLVVDDLSTAFVREPMRSRLFDGTDTQYLNRAAAVRSSLPLSMACWFTQEDATEFANFPMLMLIGTSGVNNHRWTLGFSNTGALVAASTTTTTVQATASATVGDTNFHHACGVWASNTDRAVYFDGANKGTNTTSNAPTTAGMNQTTLGIRPTLDGSSHEGKIAHAAFWSVALTDAEVALLAAGISPLQIQRANLICYLRRMGTASPEVDEIAGATFTVTGATAHQDGPSIFWRLEDTVTAIDSVASQPVKPRLLTDSVTLVDDLIDYQRRVRELTDSIATLTDDEVDWQRLVRVLTDDSALVDSISSSGQRVVRVVLEETLAILDSINLQRLRARLLSDSVVTLDDITRTRYTIRMLDEEIVINDEQLRRIRLLRLLQDDLSLFDAAIVIQVPYSQFLDVRPRVKIEQLSMGMGIDSSEIRTNVEELSFSLGVEDA